MKNDHPSSSEQNLWLFCFDFYFEGTEEKHSSLLGKHKNKKILYKGDIKWYQFLILS